MLVTLGAVLFVIVSVFCSRLLRRYQSCNRWNIVYIIAVTDVPSRIIKLTLTGFSTQPLYYPQIIAYILILLVLLFLSVFFCFWVAWIIMTLIKK
jgi:hypothetical protein